MKTLAFAIAFAALLFAPVSEDTKIVLGFWLVLAAVAIA